MNVSSSSVSSFLMLLRWMILCEFFSLMARCFCIAAMMRRVRHMEAGMMCMSERGSFLYHGVFMV